MKENDVVKTVAEEITKKKNTLAERIEQRIRDIEKEKEQAFFEFEKQLDLEKFLKTVNSLLDENNPYVVISVQGEYICPGEEYKDDNRIRFNLFGGNVLLRQPTFFENLLNFSYWSEIEQRQITLVEKEGEVYNSKDSKYKYPLYLKEKDRNHEYYQYKVLRFPIDELIQGNRREMYGTKLIQGDNNISLIISNKRTSVLYHTKFKSSDIGLTLQHIYLDRWTIANSNSPSFHWTGVKLKQVSHNKVTLVDYLFNLLKKIGIEFIVLDNITSTSRVLPLFELSIKVKED